MRLTGVTVGCGSTRGRSPGRMLTECVVWRLSPSGTVARPSPYTAAAQICADAPSRMQTLVSSEAASATLGGPIAGTVF